MNLGELRPNWETPSEFARRIGVPMTTVSRKLHRPDCPQNYDAQEGRTGRIVMLRASWDLEEFMRSNPRTLRASERAQSARAATPREVIGTEVEPAADLSLTGSARAISRDRSMPFIPAL